MFRTFKIINDRLFVNTKFITQPNMLTMLREKSLEFKNEKDHFQVLKTEGFYYQWTPQMHEQFVIAAMGQGIKTVTPKQIMNVLEDPEITRERVASHLQKYRQQVAKFNKCQISQIENYFVNSPVVSEQVHYIQQKWKD